MGFAVCIASAITIGWDADGTPFARFRTNATRARLDAFLAERGLADLVVAIEQISDPARERGGPIFVVWWRAETDIAALKEALRR